MINEDLPWYYNDEFWRILVPKFNTETHWKQAAEEVDQLINLVGISADYHKYKPQKYFIHTHRLYYQFSPTYLPD